jgi:hypothetical protein
MDHLHLPMSAVLRTRTISESLGFMKALVGARHDRIVGFMMLGAEAGDVMAAVQTAMLADVPYTMLRDAILTHPTMAEGLNALFAKVPTSDAGRAKRPSIARGASPLLEGVLTVRALYVQSGRGDVVDSRSSSADDATRGGMLQGAIRFSMPSLTINV